MSNKDRNRKRAAHINSSAKKAMRRRKKAENAKRSKAASQANDDGQHHDNHVIDAAHDALDNVKHKVKRIYTRGAKILIAVVVTVVVIVSLSLAFALYSIAHDEYAQNKNATSDLITAEEAVENAADDSVRLVGIGRSGYRYLTESGKFSNVLILDTDQHVTAADVFNQHVGASSKANTIYRLRDEISARTESDSSSSSDEAQNAENESENSNDSSNENETSADITSVSEAKAAIEKAKEAANENQSSN